MTLNSTNRAWGMTGAGLLVIVVAVFGIATIWAPRLEKVAQSIRANQASIAAIQRQQDNITSLTQQLEERTAEQSKLNTELWGFSREDDFFERWESFGTPTKTTVKLETIADAAPGPTPVKREATFTITGPIENILATIDALVAVSPAIVPQSVEIRSDTSPDRTSARLIVATLWYDDTL